MVGGWTAWDSGVVQTTTALGPVLVVEDNETTRNRITTLLRRRGFDVVEATNGREALTTVVKRRFKAIVLDLLLPEVDGWQFRATQMTYPELARIPTVIVTVQRLREPARYALRAENVIHKPFEDEALLTVMERVCGITEPPPAADSRPASTSLSLFWSRRGEVACRAHAPDVASTRWHDEQWAALPANAGNRRVLYQCQHCVGGPVGHRKRGATVAGS
jgi:CheY-like chemotaxis protein